MNQMTRLMIYRKILRTYLPLTLLLFCPLAMHHQLVAVDAAPLPAEPTAAALVKQLGDEQFSTREAATDRLIRLGVPALEALEDGSRQPDREIRYRCERILTIVRQRDFQRRLESFVSSHNRQQDFGLPGWDRFRAQIGDSAESRTLFVSMQRAEPEALESIEQGAKFVTQVLNVRILELQYNSRINKQPMPLGSIAALLFLAGDEDVALTELTNMAMLSLCTEPSFQTSLNPGPRADMSRKLFGAWLSRADGHSAQQGMNLALHLNIKEALIPAEKELRKRPSPTYIAQVAILTLAKFGDQTQLPLLESLLDDDSPVSTGQPTGDGYQVQIRDLALATLLHLTKQNLRDFGFERALPHEATVFSPNSLGFDNDEKREQSQEKWRNFRLVEQDEVGTGDAAAEP